MTALLSLSKWEKGDCLTSAGVMNHRLCCKQTIYHHYIIVWWMQLVTRLVVNMTHKEKVITLFSINYE